MVVSSLSEVALAVVLHQLLMRIELDRHPLLIVTITISSAFVLANILQSNAAQGQTFKIAFSGAWSITIRVLTYFSINIFTYRAFFHSLNQFPGPFGAKLSKFWAVRKVAQSKVRWYKVLGELNAQYGDYIRTGPRELVIFNAEAVVPLLGATSKATKGPFYDSLEHSLLSTRSQTFHRQRRKTWDLALKSTLADYSATVEAFTTVLLGRIKQGGGKKIVLNELCLHYSYDVMSSMGFGESTRFLEGRESKADSKTLRKTQRTTAAIGLLSHVPWLVTFIKTITLRSPMMKERVERRRRIEHPRPDILGYLLENTEDTPAGRKLLNADSRLIISAGSDTTSSALTVIFILMACHPDYQTRLRNEMKLYFESGTYSCTTPHPLLDGIINEALRLYPPVTFSTQRVTPAEGMTIGKFFIPGDTIVSLATWQLHHDARNFKHPDKLIPERWFSEPELILNKAAFIPFSTGPYNCPGKGLAMMELRSVIAQTISKYEIRIADESFDEKSFFGNVKDHFTAGIPRCEVVFCDVDEAFLTEGSLNGTS